MSLATSSAVWRALSFFVTILGDASFGRADIADYEFRLVRQQVKTGDATVAVRLVHKAGDRPVPDAVIFATRLDMAPAGMETMKAAIDAAPGVYRFKVDLPMEGEWRLSLAAKVQGETGTLENRLVFKAAP